MAQNLKDSEKHTGKKPLEVKDYREAERKNLAALNRKPISLEVTETNIRIRARFQVRFEGLAHKDAEKKFPVLKQNLEQGVRNIWNQRLKGAVLPGRMFEVVPEINLVPSTAVRDANFWLITVRPTDGAPIHLFGLVDRYFIDRGGENFQLRETKGRNDPLGADEEGNVKGKIMEEDLGFILSRLDVYPTIPYGDVLAELRQVEEIIKTGKDPKSMVKQRSDFWDKTIKDAEDLD